MYCDIDVMVALAASHAGNRPDLGASVFTTAGMRTVSGGSQLAARAVEYFIEAERRYQRRIDLVPRKEYHLEQFDLVGR